MEFSLFSFSFFFYDWICSMQSTITFNSLNRLGMQRISAMYFMGVLKTIFWTPCWVIVHTYFKLCRLLTRLWLQKMWNKSPPCLILEACVTVYKQCTADWHNLHYNFMFMDIMVIDLCNGMLTCKCCKLRTHWQLKHFSEYPVQLFGEKLASMGETCAQWGLPAVLIMYLSIAFPNWPLPQLVRRTL